MQRTIAQRPKGHSAASIALAEGTSGKNQIDGSLCATATVVDSWTERGHVHCLDLNLVLEGVTCSEGVLTIRCRRDGYHVRACNDDD